MFDPSVNTTVVIDTSVFIHRLYRKLQAVADLSLVKPRHFKDDSILPQKLKALTEALATAGDNDALRLRLETAKADTHEAMHIVGMVKAQLQYLMSLDWLGKLKPTGAVTTILACDLKDSNLQYWRHSYLQRPSVFGEAIEYQAANFPRMKGTQLKLAKYKLLKAHLAIDCPEIGDTDEATWLQYTEARTKAKALVDDLKIAYKAGRSHPDAAFTKLKHAVYNIADQQGWNRISAYGYEADDIAAGIVTLNNASASPDRVILATVDTDWLGLVNDNTVWVDIGGYSPRVRGDLKTINEWRVRKKERPLTSPRDMWLAKHEEGDQSDTLPPGTPLEVIDLLAPPVEYRLAQQMPFLAKLASVTVQAVPDATSALEYLTQLGCRVAVEAIS